MKKIIFVMCIFLLILLVGCKKPGNMNVEVDKGGSETKIDVESDEGSQHIEVSTKNTDDWCATGSTWSSTGSQGSAEMIVVGIETSGKYKGYCHITLDTENMNIDYYSDEDNNGYRVMVINGQKFESEWSGEE